MKPSGTSSFDDDDDGVQGSLPNARIEPVDASVPEKPIAAQRAGSMARTTKVYPQQEGTVFPRELLEFAIDAAREGYVRTANMGAAFNMMKRQLKDRWTVEKGPSGYVFKEHVHPLEAYLLPGARHEEAHKAPPPMPRAKPAVPESGGVADARKRWDAAKTAGDAGAMTRTANDLLRAVEADRAARGENAPTTQTEDGRHPTSEILAPEGSQDSGASTAGTAMAGEAGAAAGKAAGAAATEVFTPPSSVGRFGHEAADAGVAGTKIADVVAAVNGGRPDREASTNGGASSDEGIFTGGDLTRVASIIANASPEQGRELLRQFGETYGREELGRLMEYLRDADGASVDDDVGPERRVAAGDEQPTGGLTPAGYAPTERDRGQDAALSARGDRNRPPRDRSDDGPRDFHPDNPNAGMDRVKRARRRGYKFESSRDRRHWVDPEADWDQDTVDEVIRESGGKPVTPELLLVFSNEAYPDNRSDPAETRARRWRKQGRPGVREQGWEYLAGEKGDGYFGMAVYDPDTNTLVIANRGVNFTSQTDRDAAYAVIAGRASPQIARAQRLLYRAWEQAVARARALGKPPPQLIVTGHSLGGAMAQIQMATVYADQRRFAGVKVTGATFATLGAQSVVESFLQKPWRGVDRAGLSQFMKQRMVNYYREGDGMVQDRLGRAPRPMPGRFGTDVVLEGIDMQGLGYQEDNLKDLLASPDGAASSEAGRRGALVFGRYFENHSLLSYYHPDFTDPLDDVLTRRGRRR